MRSIGSGHLVQRGSRWRKLGENTNYNVVTCRCVEPSVLVSAPRPVRENFERPKRRHQPETERRPRSGDRGGDATGAARLGLADFVCQAEIITRGGGSREPGDALLYANGLGAIVQVKSRDREAARVDSPDKVQQWIDKHGNKAYRQASGTRRQLVSRQTSGSPVLALPVRASHLPI